MYWLASSCDFAGFRSFCAPKIRILVRSGAEVVENGVDGREVGDYGASNGEEGCGTPTAANVI